VTFEPALMPANVDDHALLVPHCVRFAAPGATY
jgi:hypothetical protein